MAAGSAAGVAVQSVAAPLESAVDVSMASGVASVPVFKATYGHVHSPACRAALPVCLACSPERPVGLFLFRCLPYSDNAPASQAKFTNGFPVGVADDNLKLQVSLVRVDAR